MVNYSQYGGIDGEKYWLYNRWGFQSAEPTFPMHCSNRARWFFSKFTADKWEFLSRADVLLMRALNKKMQLGLIRKKRLG